MTEPLPERDDPALNQIVERASALGDYEWSRPWKGPFLAALAVNGNVSEAARRVGISREHATRERHLDEQFDAAWKEADEIGTDFLELVGWRRATIGEPKRTTRVKYGPNGEVLERVTEETSVISNAVLITLLKARRPEKYRERYEHRVTGADGGPVRVEVDRYPTRERMLELVKLARELELPDTIEIEAAEEADVEEGEEP